MGEAVQDRTVPLAVAAEEGDGAGAVLLLHPVELLGDDLVGLVPADGFKLPLAAFAYPAQGRLDPVLPVDIVAQGGPLRAELAMVEGVVRGPFHADDPAVFYVAIYAAVDAGAADRAQGVLYLDAGILTGDLGFDSLFQLSQRMSLLKIR